MLEPDISLEQLQRDLNLNYYCNLVAFTLLYYEYLITFGVETTRIWANCRFSTPTVIFFVNRYVALLGHIPVVVEFFWTTSETELKEKICPKLQSYHQYYAVLVQVMVAVMLIIRTYALYERNKKVLTGMVLVTVGALIHGGWAVWTAKSDERNEDPMPYVGCSVGVGAALGRRLAAAWIGMLMFDTMIFLLTVFRGVNRGWAAGTFLRLLIRDGSLYYAVIIICNLANILTFYLGNHIIRGLFTTFTNVMSSILITRLVLHLRDPKLIQGTSDRAISRMVFASPSHGTNHTKSSGSRSRTTASTSRFTESTSNYDGDEHDTRSRFGLREAEGRIDEESIREEAIELTDLSGRRTGQGEV